jgi:hypothetical protein
MGPNRIDPLVWFGLDRSKWSTQFIRIDDLAIETPMDRSIQGVRPIKGTSNSRRFQSGVVLPMAESLPYRGHCTVRYKDFSFKPAIPVILHG